MPVVLALSFIDIPFKVLSDSVIVTTEIVISLLHNNSQNPWDNFDVTDNAVCWNGEKTRLTRLIKGTCFAREKWSLTLEGNALIVHSLQISWRKRSWIYVMKAMFFVQSSLSLFVVRSRKSFFCVSRHKPFIYPSKWPLSLLTYCAIVWLRDKI